MLFEFEVAANMMRKKFIYALLIELILIVLFFALFIFSNSIAFIPMLFLLYWTFFSFSAYLHYRKAKKDLKSFIEQDMIY